ncbi:MAG: hypothetical protein ACPGTP_07460, partial [Bacteroidia bacterium]
MSSSTLTAKLKYYLLFLLVFFQFHVFSQVPINDNCANAELFTIPENGFGIGTFETDSFDLDSATIEVGEYFHTSLVTSGNDKKSIWFKFYLPTRRGLDIELKQHGTAIQTNDVGFTTYFSNSCLPGSVAANDAKLTTLNQFGSSFHPCVDPGWYMVQISSKTRANDKVYLQIKTSFPHTHSNVTDAEYDVKDSAARFATVLGLGDVQSSTISFDLGCYTIDDSTELLPNLGTNYRDYNQSAWLTFKTADIPDRASIEFLQFQYSCNYDSVGYRLYEGDCTDSSATLVLLDSFAGYWGPGVNGSCYPSCSYSIKKWYNCYFDSAKDYSIQVLYHKDMDKKATVRINSVTSIYDQLGTTKPQDDLSADLGTLGSSGSYNYGFSCESFIKDQNCTSNTMPVGGITIPQSSMTYTMSTWRKFKLDHQSKLTITAGGYKYNSSNATLRQHQAFRLFKDTLTSSCTDVDTSNIIYTGVSYGSHVLQCLDSGTYLIQLLATDSVWNYSSYPCSGPMHLGSDYVLSFSRT